MFILLPILQTIPTIYTHAKHQAKVLSKSFVTSCRDYEGCAQCCLQWKYMDAHANAGKQQTLFPINTCKSAHVHMCMCIVNLVNTFKHITQLLSASPFFYWCHFVWFPHSSMVHITLWCIVICLLCYMRFFMFSQALCLHMHVFYIFPGSPL